MGKLLGSRTVSIVAALAALAAGCETVLDFGSGGDSAPADGGSDRNVGLDGSAESGSDGSFEGGPDAALLAPEDAAVVEPDAALPNPVAGCPGDAGCLRVVFLTKDPVPLAALGDAGGDDVCTSLALTAIHPRVEGRAFQAWTSSAGKSVVGRFVHGTMPYVRPDGVVIANDWVDLTDGAIAVAISRDQDGKAVNGTNLQVWTGTVANGAPTGLNCDNWRNVAAKSTVGLVGGATTNWSDFQLALCSNATLRLYCFEK